MRSISGEGCDRNSQTAGRPPPDFLPACGEKEEGARPPRPTRAPSWSIGAEEMQHLARFLPALYAEFRLHD